MSQEKGGGGAAKSPPDDRTLLDPLDPEDLRVLREARERLEKKKSAVAHQMVVGPDTGTDIGTAPTRNVPALPSFDSGGFSLDAIDTSPGTGAGSASPPEPDPASEQRSDKDETVLLEGPPAAMNEVRSAEPESAPNSVVESPTTAIEAAVTESGPLPGDAVSESPAPSAFAAPKPAFSEPESTLEETGPQASVSSPSPVSSSPPAPASSPALASSPAPASSSADRKPVRRAASAPPAGPPAGFGENTLLWMEPPKIAKGASQSLVSTGELAVPTRIRTGQGSPVVKIALFGITFLVGLVALFFLLQPTERGAIELYTTPPRAEVTIDGTRSEQLSPVKLTLPVGPHTIELRLKDHAPKVLNVDIQASEHSAREDVSLVPLSQPGLLTLEIIVEPVAARIRVDDQVHESQRTLYIPNMDPVKPHKIVVESPGYVKVEQEIPAGGLKEAYRFVLQADRPTKAK